ncbi:unnamed protein product [Didymodactylos carnosus]|uniref:Integrase catalytic domain-containing protein n=1 Tax=Didymodactylos carnosus TaxID=1234261 RepID=A0A815I8Y3_9BILA|nr:unnamed protein product [Didymodactylos carnosus]CAF4246767.1 unnamed protein product [Didymodactylos carnosus]
MLTTAPLLLKFPDDNRPIILSTDASDYGIGGVLQQEINGEPHNLCYDSQLEYNIEQVIHITGRYNCLPDFMLRHPISEKEIMHFGYSLEVSQDRPPVFGMVGVTTRSKSKLDASTNQQSIPVHPSASTVKNAPQKFVSHFDITRLNEEQANDQKFENKIEEVRANPTKHPYVFQDGILYKLATKKRGATKSKLIYLPSSMILPAFRAYHDQSTVEPADGSDGYLLGHHHIYSTTYHPHTNDMIERFNETFIPQLAKLQDTEFNNWNSFLPSMVFAYNTGQHGTTGYSSFQLQHEQKPKLPPDEPPKQVIFTKPNDYYQQLKKNLS